jgi:hypothetical protein
MADAYDEFCRTVRFNNWDDLIRKVNSNAEMWDGWIFRGHTNASHGLKTSFERAALDRFSIARAELYRKEVGLIRRFQRQAHQYLSQLPKEPDRIEWLALMQHYGAPTRLLDWTYSFHVALYFAVHSVEPNATCAIWAFDARWLAERARNVMSADTRRLVENDPNLKSAHTNNEVFWARPPNLLIYPVNSFALNARQSIQQGIFLSPGDVGASFLENMSSLVGGRSDAKDHLYRYHIDCSPALLVQAHRYLNSTNVNSASLFPGLDGFSKNLASLLVIPDALAVDPWDIATEA